MQQRNNNAELKFVPDNITYRIPVLNFVAAAKIDIIQ